MASPCHPPWPQDVSHSGPLRLAGPAVPPLTQKPRLWPLGTALICPPGRPLFLGVWPFVLLHTVPASDQSPGLLPCSGPRPHIPTLTPGRPQSRDRVSAEQSPRVVRQQGWTLPTRWLRGLSKPCCRDRPWPCPSHSVLLVNAGADNVASWWGTCPLAPLRLESPLWLGPVLAQRPFLTGPRPSAERSCPGQVRIPAPHTGGCLLPPAAEAARVS